MQRAYKLTFAPGSTELTTDLPAAADVMHFAEQESCLCLWFIDRDNAGPAVPRQFSIRGTGHEITDDARYIDTALVGPYVFHLFETTPQKDG